jgi:hypothetical protein
VSFSRQILFGILVLGLRAGLAAAQPPVPGPVEALPLPGAAGPCCPCECGPVGHSGVIGGVGLYLIQPYFENNPAYNILVENHDIKPPIIKVDRVNVSHHLDAAPLVWLGYETEDGLGGRARYWYFRQGTSQTVNLSPFTGTFHVVHKDNPPHDEISQDSGTLTTATSAVPLGLQAFGDTLSLMHGPEATSFTITTKLEVQVADLEAFQEFKAYGCDFLLSGGLRLVRIAQAYNAFDAQSTSTREFRALLSNYTFQGAGPVLAIEVRRPFGESGLSLYSSGRGSVLFGSADQTASFGGQELRNDDPNPQLARQHRSRGLPIGELEVGVEYGRSVGRSRVFGQLALVGQDWFGAGNASRSTMATPPTGPNPAVGGSAVDSNIAFFGLSVRIGVNY